MSRKSPYQLINRGRKDKPCWTIEKDGQYVCSSSKRSNMTGHLAIIRREQRRRDKELAEGYHLPGLKP